MKIEAGKFYRMRNGHKAYIAAIYNGEFAGKDDGVANSMDKCLGWMHGRRLDSIHAATWYADGSKNQLPDGEFDLISEWTDGYCWIDGKRYFLVEEKHGITSSR